MPLVYCYLPQYRLRPLAYADNNESINQSITQKLVNARLTLSQQYHKMLLQDAQLSQRDRAAECVIVFAKSRRLELGDNILRTL